MADILKLAGVTQGSLYFHFDSKIDLAYEIVKRQHDLAFALGTARVNSTDPGVQSMIGISHDLGEALITEPVMRAGLRLVTESINVFNEPAVKPYVDWIEVGRILLKRAVAESGSNKELDIDSAASVVIGSFTGTHVVASALDALPELHERIDAMWGFLLPGLGLQMPAVGA